MEVQLTPAQQARLAEIAHRERRSIGEILTDAANHILQIEEHRWQRIDHAIAQADRGEFIEEEEMDARVAAMLARS